MGEHLSKDVTEAILRYAVNKNHEREMSEIPSNEELSTLYTFSERHEKRMQKLFAKEHYRLVRKKIFIVSKRIASIFIVVIITVFGILLTNPQVRAAINHTIIDWYEKFTRFSFLNEATQTTTVESQEWYLSAIPDGFEEINTFSLPGIIRIEYMNQENEILVFDYCLSDSSSIAVDNEQKDYEVITRNEIEYHVFMPKAEEYKTSIIWQESGYSFLLKSTMDIDSLMEIAASATIKK